VATQAEPRSETPRQRHAKHPDFMPAVTVHPIRYGLQAAPYDSMPSTA
jgi:hypothetical protein